MALAPIIKANAQLIHAGAAPQAPGVSVRNYGEERKSEQIADERRHAMRMRENEQSSLLASERSVLQAKLNAPPQTRSQGAMASPLAPSVPASPIKSPFSSAPTLANGGQPSVAGRGLADSRQLLGMLGGALAPTATAAAEKYGDTIKKQMDNAMSVVGDVLRKMKSGFEVPPDGGGDGSDAMRLPDSAVDAPPAPSQQEDDVASVYAGGGSMFGGQLSASGPLAYLRPAQGAYDTDVQSKEYADGLGGLMGALLRV